MSRQFSVFATLLRGLLFAGGLMFLAGPVLLPDQFGSAYLSYAGATMLIGLILGPMAEVQMRRALAVGQGDPMVFVSTPLSAVLVAVCALVVIVPAILQWRRSRKIHMPDETAGA